MFNSSTQLASQSDRCTNSTKLFYPFRHKGKKDKRKKLCIIDDKFSTLVNFFWQDRLLLTNSLFADN